MSGLPTAKESQKHKREKTKGAKTTKAVLSRTDTVPEEVKHLIGQHAVSQAKDRVRGSLDSLWERHHKNQHKEESCRTCGHSLVSPVATLRKAYHHRQGKKMRKEGRGLVNSMHAGVDKPLDIEHSVHRIPTQRERSFIDGGHDY